MTESMKKICNGVYVDAEKRSDGKTEYSIRCIIPDGVTIKIVSTDGSDNIKILLDDEKELAADDIKRLFSDKDERNKFRREHVNMNMQQQFFE